MIKVKIIDDEQILVKVFNEETIKVGLVSELVETDTPVYSGPYTVIPNSEEQTIPVIGKKMAENMVVAPIPNNYGLITYNGYDITVS